MESIPLPKEKDLDNEKLKIRSNMTFESKPEFIQNNLNLLVKTEESFSSNTDKLDFKNSSKSFENSSKIKSDFCDCNNTNKTESEGQNHSKMVETVSKMAPKPLSKNQNIANTDISPRSLTVNPVPKPYNQASYALTPRINHLKSVPQPSKIHRSHLQKDIVKILSSSLNHTSTANFNKSKSKYSSNSSQIKQDSIINKNGIVKNHNNFSKSIQTEKQQILNCKNTDSQFVLLEKILEKDDEIK